MKLVIIGTGPGAQALASMNKEKTPTTEVVLLETSEGKIDRNVKISWPDNHISNLEKCIITSDFSAAIPNADIILLCNPANSYPNILKKAADYITPSIKLICGAPGASAFDWMVREAFEGREKLFTAAAVESLPFIAKRNGEGNIKVHVFKRQLYLSTLPFGKMDNSYQSELEKLLSVPLKKLHVFLSLTLLNPNAKVHPLLFLEALEHSQSKIERNVFELSNKNAALLEQIEKETIAIASEISLQTTLSLDPIPSLQKWFTDCYQSIIRDNTTAQTCLSSHSIYEILKDDFLKGINDENEKTSDRDKSRYLTEEIPYGLLSIKGLAELVGLATPVIDSIIEKCQKFLNKNYVENGNLIRQALIDTAAPQRFGISILSKLSRLYQPYSTDKKLEVEEFDKNGVVFFGKLLPEKYCLQIQEAVSERIENVEAVDTEKLLLNLHWSDPRFAIFCSLPEFVSTACNLLQVNEVRVFSSLIVFKKPNEKMPVPWHQDPAYQWPLDPLDCASLWFALDDVTNQNGAMHMVAGAHKVGIFPMRPTPIQEGEYHFSPQLTQSIAEEHLTNFPPVQCDMLQYESSFHHSMMPHSSPLNLSQNRRCAFIVRYCRGDAKIKIYSGMPREQFFKGYKLFNPHNELMAA
jgi:hypothetical protein